MEKTIYVIRHCKAAGQSAESPLTTIGYEQAKRLAQFFNGHPVDRIISSPFLRAIQTIEPLSEQKGIPIEIDHRLSERILSTMDLPDLLEKLKETFMDLELTYEGGESSQEAKRRIENVVEEVFKSESENTVIVSHGNIISLLLMKERNELGFDCWKNLSNPDVFKVNYSNGIVVDRIWTENLKKHDQ